MVSRFIRICVCLVCFLSVNFCNRLECFFTYFVYLSRDYPGAGPETVELVCECDSCNVVGSSDWACGGSGYSLYHCHGFLYAVYGLVSGPFVLYRAIDDLHCSDWFDLCDYSWSWNLVEGNFGDLYSSSFDCCYDDRWSGACRFVIYLNDVYVTWYETEYPLVH